MFKGKLISLMDEYYWGRWVTLMNQRDEPPFNYYRLGNLFNVRVQDGVCPEFQQKIEHGRGVTQPIHLTIEKGEGNPDLYDSTRDKLTFINDDFQPVVLAWRPTADELLVSDGRYEIVRQGGAYTIGPGRISIRGKVIDNYVEHGLLRPIANSILVPQGAMMAHAGAVCIDGKVILLLGESGKTSLVLGLLSRGAEYMADEFVFLQSNGICNAYSPYIWLDDRHFIHYPELLATCYPDPGQRKRVEKNISFFRTGYSIKGGNLLSRLLRELIIKKTYFEGLTCRFDRPFPKARMRDSGKVAYAFHLESSEKESLMVPTTAKDIARVESTAAWIKHGYHNHMMGLAGMPQIDLPKLEGVLEASLSEASCHRVRVKLRQQRSRKEHDQVVDEILKIVGMGRSPRPSHLKTESRDPSQRKSRNPSI